MNSFCNTVYVIVLLLRRRGAGQRGNERARGTMGKGKRGREAFSHFPSSTGRLILNTQYEPLKRREVIEDFLK